MNQQEFDTIHRSILKASRPFKWADEDLESVAWEGVIKSLRGYDGSKQSLSKFAYFRAKFTILNYLKTKEGSRVNNPKSLEDLYPSQQDPIYTEQDYEVRDILDHLRGYQPESYEFICDFFGLDGHEELGTVGLATKLHLSPPRISQKKKKIINYLRSILDI